MIAVDFIRKHFSGASDDGQNFIDVVSHGEGNSLSPPVRLSTLFSNVVRSLLGLNRLSALNSKEEGRHFGL